MFNSKSHDDWIPSLLPVEVNLKKDNAKYVVLLHKWLSQGHQCNKRLHKKFAKNYSRIDFS